MITGFQSEILISVFDSSFDCFFSCNHPPNGSASEIYQKRYFGTGQPRTFRSMCFGNSSRLSVIDGGTQFSHRLCHKTDNSQIQPPLQTPLITHNGSAGCTSHSAFCRISGITSFRPRNVEAIKEREVIWRPLKINLTQQMEQRLKQICASIKLIPFFFFFFYICCILFL